MLQSRLFVAFYLLAFLAGAFLGWGWRDKSARLTLAELRAAQSQQLAHAQQQARQIEQTLTQQLNQLEADYAHKQQQIESEQKQLIDNLNAGTVRLRKQWQACAATMRLPATTAPATIDNATAEHANAIRADIARIITIGKQADNRLEACQQVIRSYHDVTE